MVFIKFLSINGVYPTDETIANGKYPLAKIVYAVTRKDNKVISSVKDLKKDDVLEIELSDGKKDAKVI